MSGTSTIEALQAAHLALSLKSQKRQKWSFYDQDAIEKVRAALEALGADIPISQAVTEVPRGSR